MLSPGNLEFKKVFEKAKFTAGTFDGASSGDLAVCSISAHVVDPDEASRVKYFLGMKQEKGAQDDEGVWHYKTAELQEELVRVWALETISSILRLPHII
jgi:hypothetical protein